MIQLPSTLVTKQRLAKSGKFSLVNRRFFLCVLREIIFAIRTGLELTFAIFFQKVPSKSKIIFSFF